MIRSALMAIPDGGLYELAPPDGPPTSVYQYLYGEQSNPLVGLSWVSGDVDAWTELGFAASGEPTSHFDAVPPGVTNYPSGQAEDTSVTWWARHVRAGQYSAWAEAAG